MSYTVTLKEMMQDSNVVVVGCGGTGGFVAEGLCRLLGNSDKPLLLVDHDRVEPHNLRRQNFFAGDVGKFKSQALAERLSRLYGRQVGYSVYPYDRELVGEMFSGGMYRRAIQGIIIGCVDNVAARRMIANTLGLGNWWLDSGNGHHSGQVLIGNARDVGSLKASFNEREQTVRRLPIPTLQLPSLLAPATEPAREQRDCAEAVEAEDQSPTINQAMATLVLEFMHRLLKGTLTWMGAYIDLDAGTLQTISAEPETVARMCGVKVDTLVADICPTCGKKHL